MSIRKSGCGPGEFWVIQQGAGWVTCVEPRQTKGSRARRCAQWGVLEPKQIPVQRRADSLSGDENVAFATASNRGLHDMIGRYQVRGVVSDARKTCTLKATTRVHAAGPRRPSDVQKGSQGFKTTGCSRHPHTFWTKPGSGLCDNARNMPSALIFLYGVKEQEEPVVPSLCQWDAP